MRRGTLRGLFFAAAVAALATCKSGGQKAGTTSAPGTGASVAIGANGRKVVFHVEVALTSEQHARGLMYRTQMDPDAGMIFVFDEPSIQTFWMRNTYLPLDMIFIGADRRIVGVVPDAVPETDTERRVGAPSQYVLEIGGGLAARLGIHRGAEVDFQNIPQP